MDGITDSMDMSLRKLQEKVKPRDGEAWCAAAHGAVKSQRQLGDWTTTTRENEMLPSFLLAEL